MLLNYFLLIHNFIVLFYELTKNNLITLSFLFFIQKKIKLIYFILSHFYAFKESILL